MFFLLPVQKLISIVSETGFILIFQLVLSRPSHIVRHKIYFLGITPPLKNTSIYIR